MNTLRNYRAVISFSFIPSVKNNFNMDDIREAAEEYMEDNISDFGGLGVSETYELLEIYAPRKTALVTFAVFFSTREGFDLDCLADQLTDLGEV